TPEVHARPNGKADTDCGKHGTDPAESQGWCEDAIREENCPRKASATAKAHGGKDDDGCGSEAQRPVSLPQSAKASTTYIAFHKEGAYAPHQKKRHPAHEDNGIVGNHNCRCDLRSLQHLSMIRYYETG